MQGVRKVVTSPVSVGRVDGCERINFSHVAAWLADERVRLCEVDNVPSEVVQTVRVVDGAAVPVLGNTLVARRP